jgi:hypothetical protein
MSRRAARPRVEVQVSVDADWYPVSRGRAIPSRFWATVDDPDVPYVLRVEVLVTAGSPGVRELVVSQREDAYPPGQPVTSLRAVKVSEALRLATAAAARRRHDTHNPRWPGAFTVDGEGDRAFGGPSAGRVAPADGDRLDVVARAYRAAKAEGSSVREAVKKACGVESSHAARLIRAARAAGKIPPRTGPGEVYVPRETHGPAPRDAHLLRQLGEVETAPADERTLPPGDPGLGPELPPRWVNFQKSTGGFENQEDE